MLKILNAAYQLQILCSIACEVGTWFKFQPGTGCLDWVFDDFSQSLQQNAEILP
jgi:hypothetical protein